MEAKITINQKEFAKYLDDVAKKQLPFATAKALTKTAQDAQKKIIGDLPNKFTLRKPWWKQKTRFGINIRPARKTNLTATIYTRAPWMKLQESGGVKKPQGQYLAIPTKELRKDKTKIIRKSKRPKALLSKTTGRIRPFIKRMDSGDTAIVRRRTKKERLKVLYFFKKSAEIKPVLKFVETSEKIALKNYKKNFDKSFLYALRTSK